VGTVKDATVLNTCQAPKGERSGAYFIENLGKKNLARRGHQGETKKRRVHQKGNLGLGSGSK